MKLPIPTTGGDAGFGPEGAMVMEGRSRGRAVEERGSMEMRMIDGSRAGRWFIYYLMGASPVLMRPRPGFRPAFR